MWYHEIMKCIFSAIFTKEKKGYSVLCPELGIASQGATIPEAEKNIREAIELYIEDMPEKELRQYEGAAAPEAPIVKMLEFSHA